ncbi:L-type lectin-domain containing receptor kinase VII.1 [Linum grandiflorum]
MTTKEHLDGPLHKGIINMNLPRSTVAGSLQRSGFQVSATAGTINIKCDAVVVGSSSGGGVVAGMLANAGHKVLFVSFTGISGASSSQNLGFLNRTNNNNPNTHVFGVEFDVFANQEFNDIDDNLVGIGLNSLTSRFANPAGYWAVSGRGGSDFKPLKLNNGENYQLNCYLLAATTATNRVG